MDRGLVLTAQPQLPFLLDSNVLMEAHRRYYAFDICPGFWDSLSALSAQGDLMSIDRVLAEIQERDDILRRWADIETPSAFFVSTAESAVAEAYSRVIEWVNANSQFMPAGKADFARKADGWLVAYSMVHRITLVTEEIFDPAVKKRVPIPNVCRQFGVNYVNTFSMLRTLQVEFHWGTV